MNIPKSIQPLRSLPWARHIYTMIYGANRELCKDDAVIDAYNALIECLIKHSNEISTYMPPPSEKFRHGIEVNITYNQIYCIHRRTYITHTSNRAYIPNQNIATIVNEIYTVYNVLYLLIKDTVVPYMQARYKEEDTKLRRKQYINSIDRLKEVQHRYMDEYDAYRKQFQERMDYVQNEMQRIGRELEQLA